MYKVKNFKKIYSLILKLNKNILYSNIEYILLKK